PGQPRLAEQEIGDPQLQAAQAHQGMSGDHRHGQAGGHRALELWVILDDPDHQENGAGENGHHPREQGGDVHLVLVSDAPYLFSGVRPRSASGQLRAADQGQARPSACRFQERQALPVAATSVTDILPIRPDTDKMRSLNSAVMSISQLFRTNLSYSASLQSR